MGKYDQFLVGLSSTTSPVTPTPAKTGSVKYGEFLHGLDTPSQESLPAKKDTTYNGPVKSAAFINSIKEGMVNAVPGLKLAMDALGERPELTPFGMAPDSTASSPIGAAAEMARETVAAPIRAGSTLAAAPDIIGEGLADALGETGHPKAGAVAGTMVGMVPHALAAGGLLNSLYGSMNPRAVGITQGKKALGRQYDWQNKTASIPNERPEFSGKLPGLEKITADVPDVETMKNVALNPPKSYPRTPSGLINWANTRAKAFGGELSAQELNDLNIGLERNIDLGESYLDRMGGKGTYAQTVRTNNNIKNLLAGKINKAIADIPPSPEYGPSLTEAKPRIPKGYLETREGLDQAYKWATAMRIPAQTLLNIFRRNVIPYFRFGIMKMK